MTRTKLTAFEVPGDRLKRWHLLAEGPGRGKPIFAANIRNGEDAKKLAELWNAAQDQRPLAGGELRFGSVDAVSEGEIS